MKTWEELTSCKTHGEFIGKFYSINGDRKFGGACQECLVVANKKEQEAKEWKEQTKREADSLEKVLKEKQRLKSLDKDSLGLNILKDSIKIDEAFLEESIEELEDLVEPISDN